MRKLAIAVALASTALAKPALARDHSPYVGLEGGVMWVEDADVDYDDGTLNLPDAITVSHNIGYDVDLIAGYDFGMLRVEGELAYKRAGVNQLRIDPRIAGGGPGDTYDASGRGRALSGMIFAQTRFPRLSRRKPFHTFRDHAVPPLLQPSHPQLAVSAAIFRNGKVLLVRRARSPAKGFYSLPGGRVEFGETLHAALVREIGEETALEVAIIGLAGWREVMPAASGGGHYLIMSFAARWTAGDVMLNEELDEFRWLAPEALGELKITGGLEEIIRSARELV